MSEITNTEKYGNYKEKIAAQGQIIVKTLCSKTTSYKWALEREQKRMEEQAK